MKYQWLTQDLTDLTCEKLSEQSGCLIKYIEQGQIVIRYLSGVDEKGNLIQIPITRKGIVLELENETSDSLAKLDAIFQGLKRQEDAPKTLSTRQKIVTGLAKLVGLG